MIRYPDRLEVFLRTALLWLAPLILTACVADMDAMRADIENLKQVSFQNQQKIRDLEGTKTSLQDDLKKVKENTKGLPGEESITALRESQASLYSQVSDMLRELQVVSGRFDEYKYFMDKNVEKTSAELEVIKSKLDNTASFDNAEELNARLTAIEADIALLKGQIEALRELSRGAKGEVTGPAPPPPPTPERIYDEAYQTFKKKKYKKARGKLQAFIKDYPKNKLAGNAAFWIGETYYMEQSYEDAILAYEDVLQKYKDSSKVPASMLKQAYAFLELGDKQAAEVILKELIRKYPKDETASAARSKLETIK